MTPHRQLTKPDLWEAAIHALSQSAGPEAVESLIQLAQNHADPLVRRSAIFSLGRSLDPRARAFFDDTLRRAV